MRRQAPFLIFSGAILVAAVVTAALYNVSAANAQRSSMTGPNVTKTANMTAGGNLTQRELKSYSECLRSECELF